MPWRVKFDNPREHCYQPGIVRARHSRDWRPEKDALQGVRLDEASGVLMLEPRFLRTDYGKDFTSLIEWRVAPDFWQEFYRGQLYPLPSTTDIPRMFTPKIPPGSLTEIALGAAVITELSIVAYQWASAATQDTLDWVAESQFTLDRDEGIIIHMQTAADEMHRFRNFFGVAFGHIYLHMGYDGYLSCHLWDRDDISGTPTLFWREKIAEPSEIIGAENLWLMCIPMPGFGLSVAHSFRGPAQWKSRVSTSFQAAGKSVLIPVPSERLESGELSLTPATKISIALNLNISGISRWGLARVRYNTSGSYTDTPFDFGIKLDTEPEAIRGIGLTRSGTSYTAELRNVGNTDAWSGTDASRRRARVKLTLSTTDTKHTPFVYGWQVINLPVRQMRDTTPVEADAFTLQLTENEIGRREGICRAAFFSEEGKKICERGSATVLLEWRASDEDEWEEKFSGWALLREPVKIRRREPTLAQCYYDSLWTISDDTFLLSESTATHEGAIDGEPVADAINEILLTAGEPMIDLGDFPSELTTLLIPGVPQGQTWRQAMRPGDDGYVLARKILAMARRELTEYQLVKRPVTTPLPIAGGLWQVRLKPHDLVNPPWRFTPWPDEHNPGIKYVAHLEMEEGVALKFRAEPPEGTIFQSWGLTDTDGNKAVRVASTPLVNRDALDNVDSPDYLGRHKRVNLLYTGLTDTKELNRANVRAWVLAGTRVISIENLEVKGYYSSLVPNDRARLRGYVDGGRGELFDGLNFWIKRVTVFVECSLFNGEDDEYTQLDLSSMWYGGDV